jgi:hypothetical protein
MRWPTVVGLVLICGCATSAEQGDPLRYRLAEGGAAFTVAGTDPVLEDLEPRYPAYFASIYGPAYRGERDLRPLRDDLERSPVDRRNYDSLNAIAIGYFELNARAETLRDSGSSDYLGGSFQVAKLVGVPWRAYREIDDPALRDAILDFFDDASRGEKPGSAATNTRLANIVESLAKNEDDPARTTRIQEITERLSSASGPASSPF